MTLAPVSMGIAWAAAALGVLLLGFRLFRRRPPVPAGWAHPLMGLAAVGLVYAATLGWSGERSLPFDAGALVLTLTLFGGGLLFALRLSRLPRPLFVILIHGAAAILGCCLLVVGLLR